MNRLINSEQDVELLLRLARYYHKYGAGHFNSKELRGNMSVHRAAIYNLLAGQDLETPVPEVTYIGTPKFFNFLCVGCGKFHFSPAPLSNFVIKECEYCTEDWFTTLTVTKSGDGLQVTNFQPCSPQVLNLSPEECFLISTYMSAKQDQEFQQQLKQTT